MNEFSHSSYHTHTHIHNLGLYPQAIAAWEQGIQAATPSSPPSSPSLTSPTSLLLSKSYANCAQAYLQLHEYAQAQQAALAALKLNPTNIKAAVRRATALLALERYEDAGRVLNKAMRLSSSSSSSTNVPPSLLKNIQNLQLQIRRMNILAQKPAGRDADAGEAKGLVDEAQTLRLSFKEAPVSVCRYGEWMTVTLFLANEFGLWRRGDFPCKDLGEEVLPLMFEVYEHGGTYCEVSGKVKVEAVMMPGEGEEEEEEGEEGGEGGRKGTDESTTATTTTAAPVLKRGSSCRLCVRLRFSLLDNDSSAADASSPSIVHLMVSLPQEKLIRDVLPVFSLPIHLSSTSDQTTNTDTHTHTSIHQHPDLVIHSCRGIYVPSLHRRLLIGESPGQIYGKLWDAGLVLTSYLAQHPEVLLPSSSSSSSSLGGEKNDKENKQNQENKKKRVIELGAGTGITGVAAALLGAEEVVITDLAPVVPLIQTNIDLNLSSPSSSSEGGGQHTQRQQDTHEHTQETQGKRKQGTAIASAYSWGEKSRSEIGLEPYPVILLADVVYQPAFYSALVTALWELSDEETVIVLAHRERHPDCALFFKEVDERFTRQLVPFSSGGGSCEDVQIFEMRRRRVGKKEE